MITPFFSPPPPTVTPCLSNATRVQLLETRRQTGLLSTADSFVLLEIPLSHQNPHWSQDLRGLWAQQAHQPIFTGLPGLQELPLLPLPTLGHPGLGHCDADFLLAESPFLCPHPLLLSSLPGISGTLALCIFEIDSLLCCGHSSLPSHAEAASNLPS